MTRIEVFLDSSFAIALSNPRDALHATARSLVTQLRTPGFRVVTTRAVIVEIGNALSRSRYREAAVTLITNFELDPDIEIVPLSEELFERAFSLFRDRSDKGWGLTDCVSFVVMRERGIGDALSADHHFRQAGFRTLLSPPTG